MWARANAQIPHITAAQCPAEAACDTFACMRDQRKCISLRISIYNINIGNMCVSKCEAVAPLTAIISNVWSCTPFFGIHEQYV